LSISWNDELLLVTAPESLDPAFATGRGSR
jgi:hypothetical protein